MRKLTLESASSLKPGTPLYMIDFDKLEIVRVGLFSTTETFGIRVITREPSSNGWLYSFDSFELYAKKSEAILDLEDMLLCRLEKVRGMIGYPKQKDRN